MKAKLIRQAKRLVRDKDRTGKRKLRIEKIPAGTEIEGPKVHLLCLQGMAVPMDKECMRKVNMTDEQIEAATKAYEKIAAGIQPEDYDAFERGLMSGYKPDGKEGDTWKPGKNWTPGCEDDYYDSEEEDDDE